MKDLLLYILSNISENGQIKVEEEENDGFITLNIYAPKDEIGKIIGKSGKTINSIKNIIKIKAIKENKKVDVQISELE
ncbi:KH domain-containing protein [Candidatus Parcubacteria bacterium]|nr:MAG: KH domain-containing protein [Candidatus Parcubacteria bacterium]